MKIPPIHVRDGDDNGPDTKDAVVRIETDPKVGTGKVDVTDYYITVSALGKEPYVKQLYHDPDLIAELPISLHPLGSGGLVPRIRIEGIDFKAEHGPRWVWAGGSCFRLLEHFLRTGDVHTQLEQWREIGRKSGLNPVLRVFREYYDGGGLGFLKKEEWPDYYTKVAELTDLIASYGCYVEWTAGDANALYPGSHSYVDHGAFQASMEAFVGALGSRTNAFFEATNEAGHGNNNVVPAQLHRPNTSLLCSCGSGLGGYLPPQPAWDYVTDHPRRDYPKNVLDAQLIEQIYGWVGFAGWHRPTIGDEPIGFATQAQDGKRSNDPRLAHQLGTAYGNWCGGTFHSTNGVQGFPLDEVELKCCLAFFAGLAGSLTSV